MVDRNILTFVSSFIFLIGMGSLLVGITGAVSKIIVLTLAAGGYQVLIKTCEDFIK